MGEGNTFYQELVQPRYYSIIHSPKCDVFKAKQQVFQSPVPLLIFKMRCISIFSICSTAFI